MAKMHTRMKRAKKLTKARGHTVRSKQGNGRRTFGTREAALAYAKDRRLKGRLVMVKKAKRFGLELE